jgi:DNA-binding transcriptional LysR family regulator
MRIQALQVFVELSEAESIRQLARAYGVKSSVVSRQIESVEYFFKAQLFDRNAEGIKLTESGRLLVSHARSILAGTRNARAVIDDLRGLERGEVIIYAGGAAAAGILAPVVGDLHSQHPGLRFRIQVASANEVFAAVADGDADLGLTMFSPQVTKVDIRFSTLISHALIIASDHPLAAAKSISLEMLSQTTLAMPDGSYGVRRRLNEIASEAKTQIDPVFVSGSLETQKELALRGAAALILPVMCCRREVNAGLLKAIPLEPSVEIVTTIDLCCAPGRTLPFAARKLVTALSQVMASSSGRS